MREKKGEKTTSLFENFKKKGKTTVYQMMNGCESPGARVRARARIQLEKLFPNSSKVKEEEEEEEEEEEKNVPRAIRTRIRNERE